MTSLPSTGPLGVEVEREVLSSSPWYPRVGYVGMVQSCTGEGLGWTLGSICLLT